MADPTVASYLRDLPAERRAACKRLRTAIKSNLPAGFKETIGYGMPSYVVPKRLYPAGYHCDPSLPLPFISFASQKSHVALHHMGLHADPSLMRWWTEAWARHVATRLDMGKGCVRFKKPETIPCELIGELCTRMTPERWIEIYDRSVRR